MLVNQSKHVSTCFTEVHDNAQHTNMIHMFHINKHPHVMFGSRLNVTDIVRFHENTFASSSTQSPAIASQHAEVIGRIVVQFGSTLGRQAILLSLLLQLLGTSCRNLEPTLKIGNLGRGTCSPSTTSTTKPEHTSAKLLLFCLLQVTCTPSVNNRTIVRLLSVGFIGSRNTNR